MTSAKRNGETVGQYWSISSTPMVRRIRIVPIHSRVRSIGSILQTTETPFPERVVAKRLVQTRGIELRPTFISHPHLGVGDLPEKEIADAHLAGGANQKIGV